ELGLAFLARHQQEDGSWTLGGFDVGQNDVAMQLSSDTAATGLAILAFQGAGYNHREFKYASQLQAAIDWLVEHQQPSGELYLSADEQSNKFCRLYSHGIASLALTEAYGMTQDESLLPALRKALDFIGDSQHPDLGGWRYVPGEQADTSVTGWMMMAMQSARLAGLETDPKVWIGIERWADNAQDVELQHLFRYRPEARDTDTTRHGRTPSPCMTAVGLLMRLYMGWDRIDPRLLEGSEYLMEHLPSDSSINTRDTYYWYYATQIIRHVGGESWDKWHGALHPLLVQSQIKEGDMAGSWDPLNPVPDRWGAQAGRLYVTTMNLLSLEVDYRLLPLYDETVK
ncbi:MAG: prenyltransferase/squalene oxidase repeat-containing protein, partial [Pirellulaceae bacterium]